MKLNSYYENLEWRIGCAKRFFETHKWEYTILEEGFTDIHIRVPKVDFFVYDCMLHRVLAVMMDGGDERNGFSDANIRSNWKRLRPRLEQAARLWVRHHREYYYDKINLAQCVVFGSQGEEPEITLLTDATAINTFDRVYGF